MSALTKNSAREIALLNRILNLEFWIHNSEFRFKNIYVDRLIILQLNFCVLFVNVTGNHKANGREV